MMEIQEQNLPTCSTIRRIVPHDFVRSSLFTVSNHKIKREYFKKNDIYAFGNTKITYTGEELRQDDEDVWMHLIYLAAKRNTLEVDFMPYKFMRQLDWPARVQYRDKLKESIDRMVATNITITNTNLRQGLSISLIRKFIWKDDDEQNLKYWSIYLEPELVKLFDNFSYVKLYWEQRQKLKPLAKWLHAYYSSHSEPFAVKLSTIQQASGSKTKQAKHFKENVRKSLIELAQVGYLETFWIDEENRIHVVKAEKPRKYVEFNAISPLKS